MLNSTMTFEEVDLIRYLGNDEYHVIFISYVDENEGKFNVYEPNYRFNKNDVVKAFEITAIENITMNISEFDTLKEAIQYVSDGSLDINSIQNINAKKAVRLISDKKDEIIAYSQTQIN